MRFPRLAMTSLTFMLDWVPEPVCQTLRGNWSAWSPARISSQTVQMRSASRPPMVPSSALASAAARLRIANAEMMPAGMRSSPILKFSSERCVWAPQSALLSTRTSPMESCSTR